MLLRHSAFYLLARGVPGFVNFAALALFTRLLSPAAYGRYALLVASADLVGAVVFRWLALSLLRFFAAYEERERLLGTLLTGFLLLVAGVLTLTGAALVLSGPAVRPFVALGAALLLAQAWFELNLEGTRASLRPARYGLLTLARSLLFILSGGLLVRLGYGAAGVAAGAVLAALLPTLFAASLWRGARPNADPALLRRLLRYGLPLTATFALSFVVNSSDRLLLGLLVSAEAAGLYAVGYDLAQGSLTVLMMTVTLAAYPLVVKALEGGGVEAARERLEEHAVALFALALPAASGLSLLAPNVVHVVLGSAFEDAAARLIPLIVVGALLAGVRAYYLDLSFQLQENTRALLLVTAAAAFVNLGLNLLWIPRFGPLGAAYATVAAYAVGLVASWRLGRPFPLPLPRRDLAKVALAALVMTFALLPTLSYEGAAPLVAQVSWGVFIYAMALFGLDAAGVRSKLLPSSALWGRLRGYRREP